MNLNILKNMLKKYTLFVFLLSVAHNTAFGAGTEVGPGVIWDTNHINSSFVGNYSYATTSDEAIFKSADGGQSWIETDNEEIDNLNIEYVCELPKNYYVLNHKIIHDLKCFSSSQDNIVDNDNEIDSGIYMRLEGARPKLSLATKINLPIESMLHNSEKNDNNDTTLYVVLIIGGTVILVTVPTFMYIVLKSTNPFIKNKKPENRNVKKLGQLEKKIIDHLNEAIEKHLDKDNNKNLNQCSPEQAIECHLVDIISQTTPEQVIEWAGGLPKIAKQSKKRFCDMSQDPLYQMLRGHKGKIRMENHIYSLIAFDLVHEYAVAKYAVAKSNNKKERRYDN